jgi:hypothetical protein
MLSIPQTLRSIVDEDGAAILDIPRDQMVTLNSTGGYIWDKLRQGKTIDETIHDLVADTHADLITVERDVHAFVEQLMSSHLLES